MSCLLKIRLRVSHGNSDIISKICLGGRSTVLVRDLPAERTAAAAVTDALADANAWQNEPNAWSVSDLTDALEALTAVKSLGDAVTLEWRGDRRLSVYALPPDGIRWQAAEGVDRWFEVRGEFSLDDGRILSVVRLLESLPERQGSFVPFGDRAFVKLTRELLRRLEALDAQGWTYHILTERRPRPTATRPSTPSNAAKAIFSCSRSRRAALVSTSRRQTT